MLPTQKSIDKLSYQIIGAAIEVHKRLGPGLLESIYHKCMAIELATQNIRFASELVIPIEYKGHFLDAQLRCDFLVEEQIVVEIKSVSEILPIHQAQIINYLNLLKAPKGVLINFNVVNIFHNGQKTFVNKYYERLDNVKPYQRNHHASHLKTITQHRHIESIDLTNEVEFHFL